MANGLKYLNSRIGMPSEFSKRILEGVETQIDKINDTCRRRTLNWWRLFSRMSTRKLCTTQSSVRWHLYNKLIYSGKIIHSFTCKQLKVSKPHELWFLFAKRLLRFSMQEFYVVTKLKSKIEPGIDLMIGTMIRGSGTRCWSKMEVST